MENDVSMGGGPPNGGPRGRGRGRGRGERGRGRGRGRGERGGGQPRQSIKSGPGSTLVAQFQNRRGRGRVLRGRGGRGPRGPEGKAEDVDGDSAMRETIVPYPKKQEHTSWIMVRGFDQSVDMPQLIQFILSKVSGSPPTIVESNMDNGKAFIMFENALQAMTVQKLSGIKMNGQKLNIVITSYRKGVNEQRQGLVGNLENFIATHYNQEAKFLNLANLGGTQQEMIRFDFNQVGFMRSFFQAMANKCPDVTTINFANNQITSLQGFSHLGKYLTHVVNLSFDTNNISDFNELDNLKDVKLREVVFNNNPLTVQGEAKYQNEITRRFTTIKYLDAKKVEPLITFGLPTHLTNAASLPPIKGNWYDTPQTQQLVEGFLTKYFQLYDSGKRDGLLDVYADTSLFSVSTSGREKFRGPPQQKPPNPYQPMSRNLNFLRDPERRLSSLHQGRIDIIHTLNAFPPTRHSFEDVRVDAFVLGDLGASAIMCINLHGHFWESNTSVNRAYDRSFLLTPSTPGSNAANQGWPVVIMNDQLHIRPYLTGLPQVQTTPQPSPSHPSHPSATPLSSPIQTPIMSPPVLSQPSKPEMLQKLMFVTKLKQEFAAQALEQNGWQYERALEAFMTLKNNNQISPAMLDG